MIEEPERLVWQVQDYRAIIAPAWAFPDRRTAETSVSGK
jgi:hypothetical protein